VFPLVAVYEDGVVALVEDSDERRADDVLWNVIKWLLVAWDTELLRASVGRADAGTGVQLEGPD
jgi:hypothetical protein